MSYFTWLKQSIMESPWKALLLGLIFITALTPVLFVSYPDPEFGLSLMRFLAKLGSLSGTVLLMWQLLLGFRGALGWFTGDLLWVIELHKKLGAYGTILILLHPVFISIYYVLVAGFLPLTVRVEGWFGYVMLGQISLLVLLIVTVTSVWFRSWMSFSVWRMIHFSSYLILPLGIVHALPLGSTLEQTGLRYVWYLLAGLLAAFYVYRIIVRAGLLAATYDVAEVKQVADRTVEIQMAPVTKRLEPFIAQFVYFRRKPGDSTHPYTVSRYEPDTGRLAITVKALGDTSGELQEISVGERVWVEGPFGIFTREARETGRPLVMVAGGIGITPFIRVIEKIEKYRHRDGILFYANRFKKDIAYKDELDNLEHVGVVHVLSEDEDFEGEKGFVTLDLIRKHLDRSLLDYEFLLCGPEPMVVKLEEELLKADAPPAQIHHELFAY